jgi:hypothetical protein
MYRLSIFTTRWVCAISMVFVLLAWPLHMAQHAAEATGSVTADMTADFGADAEPVEGSGNARSHACAWCMFHGDYLADGGSPPVFRFHAQASAPPRVLPPGQPTGCCVLAAKPRGPPTA